MPQIKNLATLDLSEAQAVNTKLAALGNYFPSVGAGLSAMLDVLMQHGVSFGLVSIPSPQYGTIGDRHTIVLNRNNPEDSDLDVEITNRVLVLSTYRMPSGNIEMVSYVS